MKKNILSVITLSLIASAFYSTTLLSENYAIESTGKEKVSSTYSQKYNLKENTYTSNDITIRYPQVTNLKDKNNQDCINKLLKDKAISQYDETIANLEKDQTYEVDGNYDIKLDSDKILSIAYTSYNNIVPSAHPYNMFYTININMETGKELILSDFVPNIDDTFISKLKDAKYVGSIDKIYEKQLFDEIFSYYSNNDELIKSIKNAPFYITNDSIGISLPVSHVFGDFANLEIELKDLK
ncbi:MAG: PdaC/SigV domain-containing protein [Peptostreptococcaceae bacterium]